MLEAGHEVTLVAPMPNTVEFDPVGLVRVGIPRSVGWRRIGGWMGCFRAVRCLVPAYELVLVHDPELIPVLARLVTPVPLVWDVHEDFLAAIPDRRWIPTPIRPVGALIVRTIERWAGGRAHVIVAESSYRERFPNALVVPNSTWIPERTEPLAPGRPARLVHVGRLSRGRGVDDLLYVGKAVRPDVDLVLIGDADPDVRDDVRLAHDRGDVRWLGAMPNPLALAEVDGALAALSLLRDEPNYVRSMPTKLLEYLAHGVPVITTPLPLAEELVTASGGGAVVGWGDASGVVDVVRQWMTRPDEQRATAARAGHRYVRDHHNWGAVDGPLFVDELVRVATLGQQPLSSAETPGTPRRPRRVRRSP